jgi:hypothetical protein
MMACNMGHVNIVKILLEAKADVNANISTVHGILFNVIIHAIFAYNRAYTFFPHPSTIFLFESERISI